MTRFLLWIGILALHCTGAYALTADKQLVKNDLDFGASISRPYAPAQNSLFPAHSNQKLWIQENLGDDFYSFFSQKIVRKSSNIESLQLEYFLKPEQTFIQVSNQSGNVKNSIISNADPHNSIQALEATQISFSEDGLEWNSSDIAIVNLGNDYQKFIDDEVLANRTYREFWDGVETTQLEDFIDDHFAFHDNALIRMLIMLGLFLLAVLAIAERAELADYFMSEENINRVKKWFKSLYS